MTKATGARAAAKLATREALIDAGLAELAEHGPDASSLDAICARAGYTRGAFYVHFPDRESFLLAVMDRVLGDFLRALAGGSPATGTFAAAIRHFTAAADARAPAVHADTAIRFHHILAACRSSTAIGDRYRGLLRTLVASMIPITTADQRGKRLRRDVDPEAIVELALATALGVVVLLELDHPCSPGRIGETLLTLLDA
jgi:AcrR family transcriptional regulator